MKIIIDNREPDILITTLNDLIKDNNIELLSKKPGV